MSQSKIDIVSYKINDDLSKLELQLKTNEPVQVGKKSSIFDPSEYIIAFSTTPKQYCVGLVDMVNSTKISARLSSDKVAKYYQIFLNTMTKVLKEFDAVIIKNIGDSLLYYFPESQKNKKSCFISFLESSMAMIQVRQMLCQRLHENKLPSVDYRISGDFGSVVTMSENGAESNDMIGPPINMCSKINRMAATNGCVIGGDLYQMVKDCAEFRFKQISGCPIGLKYQYPVYSVSRNF